MKRLGRDDQLVEWLRPSQRPRWLPRAQFLALPETLLVRELRVRIVRRGWRTQEVTLGMDPLRCQTAAGVMKELAMFALVYNLVRLAMHGSGWMQGVAPERISFTDALRWLCAERSGKSLANLKLNPKRPGRYEPRVRKRRPKQYPLMKRPREEFSQEFLSKQVTPQVHVILVILNCGD